MQRLYGKKYGLALHVIQRWGSTYSVPNTLLRAQGALRDWANDPRVRELAKEKEKEVTKENEFGTAEDKLPKTRIS